MLGRILTFLALLGLGACCCGGPVDAERRIHAVRLNGVYYLLVSEHPVDSTTLGPEYARVLRKVECEGLIWRSASGLDDPCDLRDGDSSVLPAGTALYTMGTGNVPAHHRLAAVMDDRIHLFNLYFPPD